MIRLSSIAAAIAACLTAASPQAAVAAAAPRVPSVLAGTPLENVSRTRIHSALANADYDVWISLPADYATTKRRYPMLVLLDGMDYFATATNSAWLEGMDGSADQLILVSISASGPLERQTLRRMHDFVPDGMTAKMASYLPYIAPALEQRFGAAKMRAEMKLTPSKAGGAPAFLSFLERELLPAMQRRYRVDPAVLGLAGHSLGGTFASYALLKGAPFSRYLIASFSSDWYGLQVPALEAGYAARRDDRPIRVYETHGSHEDDPAAGGDDLKHGRDLLDRLAAAKPAWVTVTHGVVPDQGHTASVPASLAAGIRTLFPPKH
jgi:predicted alpha/beta superfamily hydrolase